MLIALILLAVAAGLIANLMRPTPAEEHALSEWEIALNDAMNPFPRLD